MSLTKAERLRRNEEIKILVESGATIESIAQKFNLSKAQVHNICKQMGISSQAYKIRSDRTVERIRDLLAQGKTTKEIGEELGGLADVTIRAICTKNNIKIPKKGYNHELVAKIREYGELGWTALEIAIETGYHIKTIQLYAQRENIKLTHQKTRTRLNDRKAQKIR